MTRKDFVFFCRPPPHLSSPGIRPPLPYWFFGRLCRGFYFQGSRLLSFCSRAVRSSPPFSFPGSRPFFFLLRTQADAFLCVPAPRTSFFPPFLPGQRLILPLQYSAELNIYPLFRQRQASAALLLFSHTSVIYETPLPFCPPVAELGFTSSRHRQRPPYRRIRPSPPHSC